MAVSTWAIFFTTKIFNHHHNIKQSLSSTAKQKCQVQNSLNTKSSHNYNHLHIEGEQWAWLLLLRMTWKSLWGRWVLLLGVLWTAGLDFNFWTTSWLLLFIYLRSTNLLAGGLWKKMLLCSSLQKDAMKENEHHLVHQFNWKCSSGGDYQR